MFQSIRICFVALVTLVASAAHAANNWTDAYYEINEIVVFSTTEPIYPQWAGYSSVTFKQPLVWGVANVCSNAGVAVRPADKHIFASIQVAHATSKRLRLYVDDSNSIGGQCILRAIQYGA